MNRITIAHLQAIIDRLNRATNSPAEPYVKGPDGRHVAQPGCWHLSRAYGGFALHRMSNESGGAYDPFHGHMTARQLAQRMQDLLTGFDLARNT